MEKEEIEILDVIPPKKKGSQLPYVIGIVLSLILVITITVTSYAYFVANVSGTSNETVVTTAALEIEYTDGPQVGLINAIPGSYIEKTFKVENNGSGDTTYDVYMSDLINNFADKTDLVYTITSNDGGYNVSSQTQVPDTSSKIVNSQLLRAGETHNYTLRIDFKETNDNQDDNKGKQFSTIIKINEVQNTQLSYTVESGDLATVGSVVKIGTEEFYVIGQEDSTHVKLLSKWNLNVGNNIQPGEQGIQNSKAIGYNSDSSTGVNNYYPATVAFSSTNYWYDGSSLKPAYGSSYPAYVYDSNASIKTYVDTYVTYLTNQGVNVSGRLIKQEELVALGCNASSYTCQSAPEWIYQTSYWSGLAYDNYDVCGVNSLGDFRHRYYVSDNYYGVRPVIILEK